MDRAALVDRPVSPERDGWAMDCRRGVGDHCDDPYKEDQSWSPSSTRSNSQSTIRTET
jgi:hypothetical protein